VATSKRNGVATRMKVEGSVSSDHSRSTDDKDVLRLSHFPGYRLSKRVVVVRYSQMSLDIRNLICLRIVLDCNYEFLMLVDAAQDLRILRKL
jgi:hypothetical protein